jgi:hypothetical protein
MKIQKILLEGMAILLATATAMAQEAQVPVITGQPQGFDYYHVYGTGTLNVTANSTDGGMLSYQWYENTTNSNSGGLAVRDTNSGSVRLS